MKLSEIDRYLREQRRQLEEMEAGLQLAMWAIYEDAIGGIEAEIERLLRRGGDVSRLRYLEQLINTYLIDWQMAARGLVLGPSQNRAREMARRDLNEMWRVMTGDVPEIGPLLTASVRSGFVPRFSGTAFENVTMMFRVGSPLDQSLASHGDELRNVIRQEVMDGVAQGRGGRDVLMRIHDRATGDYAQARVEGLVRTEMMRAYRAQNDADFDALGIEPGGWMWSASKSKRTCLACFVGDTRVSGPSVEKGFSRHYVGDVLIVKTANGKEITVTPNHPILTPAGWVRADFLNVGDEVITEGGRDDASAGGINVDDRDAPPTIKEVFESLPVVLAEVPTSAPDFHGDGEGSNICVIRANSLLGDDVDPSHSEHIGNSVLRLAVSGDEALGRSLLPLFCRSATLFPSFEVGSGMILDSGGSMGKWDSARSQIDHLLMTAKSSVGELEARVDALSGGRILGRDLHHGVPVGVELCDFCIGEAKRMMSLDRSALTSESIGFGFGSGQPALSQDAEQSLVIDSADASSILGPHAPKVSTDRIIHVSRQSFSGHVYNLQTVHGWYSANGIIAHNCLAMDGTFVPAGEPKPDVFHIKCRCRWLAVPAEGMDLFLADRESGEDWLRQQDDETLMAMMPNAEAREAFRRGELTLGDFTGVRSHPVWGVSVYQDSGRNALLRMRGHQVGAPEPMEATWRPAAARLLPEKIALPDEAIGPIAQEVEYWNPPAPGKATWRKGMPEERDAQEHLGADWVRNHSTKTIPDDIAETMGVQGRVVAVSEHALNVMPDGAKHDNARPYFEMLEDVLANSKYIGPSQAVYVSEDQRWELYTPVGDDRFVLTVLGTSPANPQGEVVSVYVVGMGTMETRLAKVDPNTGRPYLIERKKK